MARPREEITKVVGCRFTLTELAEIDDYLQRAGVGRADFMRNALLSKVRGATTFAEMLPSIAASLERQMAELARTVETRSNEILTLAAAGIASSAMLLDDGSGSAEVAAQAIEDGITRAVAFAPRVIGYLPAHKQEPPHGGSKR